MSKILAYNLRLDIEHTESNELRISLRDDLTFVEVAVVYKVNEPVLKGGSRAYQIREAIVIAMRRLIGEGIVAGLISDVPGEVTYKSRGAIGPSNVILFQNED